MNDHPLSGLEELQMSFTNNDSTTSKAEYLKGILRAYVDQLKALEEQQADLEFNLGKIKKTIVQIKREIFKEWSPFINGADKAELDFTNCKLVIEPVLDVSMEDSEEATNWLLNNGYKDVMKFQIHSQTFKKIGRELYRDSKNQTIIPGVKYEEIQVIKLKK